VSKVTSLTDLAPITDLNGISTPLCRITFEDGREIESACIRIPSGILERIMQNDNKPETLEDWKALAWFYSGSKPSKVKEFYVHIDRATMSCYLISFE